MYRNHVHIPADVPQDMTDQYAQHYHMLTQGTHRLFVFSCDQKIEHGNDDFYGPTIAHEANHPENLFKIASEGRIGAMATQLGLISRYSQQYPGIKYIVKLNSKTNLMQAGHADPISSILWSIDDVVTYKKQTNAHILGIGYTVYIGSEYEHIMLNQAAQAIFHAHQNGLLAMLWVYPRGRFLAEKEQVSATCTGLAAALGADIVKIHPPHDVAHLKIATQAAGNTKVVCAGGESQPPEAFLKQTFEQISQAGTSGCAVGRNIFQKSPNQAIAFTKALSSIVYDLTDVTTALLHIQ